MIVAAVMSARSAPSLACSVPVFRYALERWPADYYYALIFHRGPMTAKDRALVDRLAAMGSDEDAMLNCRVEVVDVEAIEDPIVQRIWRGQSSPKLPWMVVGYPHKARIDVSLWAGPVSDEAIKALVDSPVRREIVKRLVEGESAVWVLLESGDASKDNAVAKRLLNELAKLEKVLKLPDPTLGTVYDGEETDEPDQRLRLAFSVVRVRREDPKEKVFVDMLIRSEPDLHTFSEPMAFPVFGRGRLLYALVGKGISSELIGEACAFLTGPCSCQVKDLNPGIDLLMSADWEGEIDSIVDEADLAELMSGPTSRPGGATSSAPSGSETSASSSSGSGVLVRNVLLTLGGLALLTVATSLVIRRRSRSG